MSTEPNLRLPVKREPVPPPALWRQAAPVLARGVALVAAGVLGEWLLRSAARRALRPPPQSARKSRALAKRPRQPVARGEIAVSETVIMRRVIVRR